MVCAHFSGLTTFEFNKPTRKETFSCKGGLLREITAVPQKALTLLNAWKEGRLDRRPHLTHCTELFTGSHLKENDRLTDCSLEPG